MPKLDSPLMSVRTIGAFVCEDWQWIYGAESQDSHVHAEWHLCQYLNRPGRYRVRGSEENVAAGQYTVVSGSDVHGPADDQPQYGAYYRMWYFTDEYVKRIMAMVSPAGRPAARVQVVGSDRCIQRSLAALSSSTDRDATDPAETDAVLTRLLGLLPDTLSQWAEKRNGSLKARLARDFMMDHRHRRTPLADVAAAVEASESLVAHSFRSEYHLSPAAFGLRIRTDEARRQLADGVAIADVAALCGFADHAHLTRCFKRFVGVTPSAYLFALQEDSRRAWL